MSRQVGPRIRISELIARAREQGCELRYSTNRLVTQDGFRQIRFLFNPGSGKRFDLTDYDDDEYMLASEIDAARRRLNILLP
jgi:predicted RNA-binding protein associated with RNAse of E/G family